MKFGFKFDKKHNPSVRGVDNIVIYDFIWRPCFKHACVTKLRPNFKNRTNKFVFFLNKNKIHKSVKFITK